MAKTGQDVVNTVQYRGFDATTPEVLALADIRQKTMLAEARALRKSVSVGPTVANQQAYSLPAGVVEIYELYVGGVEYGRGQHSDIASYANSNLVFDGEGLWVPEANSSGTHQIALVPIPTASGTTITAYAAIEATADLDGVGDAVAIPDRYFMALIWGVMADLTSMFGEDENASAVYERRFEMGTEAYATWIKRQQRGRGPKQIRVQGINA